MFRDVGKGAMMYICALYRLRDEINAITPRFSYLSCTINIIACVANLDTNSQELNKRWRGIFKGLSQDVGLTDFFENPPCLSL
jgi:hypothetical protein